MIELLRRLLIRPALFTELVLTSLLANVLALATPLFVIQVLNRYVANGVDATLMTLATGALIAVVLEFAFRQVRNRLARGVSVKPDEQISLAGFGVLTNAKAGLLERLPPGQQREIITGIDNIKTAYNANNITAVLDLPFALLFLGVLFLLSTTLGMIVSLRRKHEVIYLLAPIVYLSVTLAPFHVQARYSMAAQVFQLVFVAIAIEWLLPQKNGASG